MNAEATPSIAGTWDFKWVPGSTIRLAFQESWDCPSETEFQGARARIVELAQSWLSGASGAKPNIGLVDSGVTFQPAPRHQRGHQNRSTVAPGSRHDYDVLISLDRLPLARVDLALELRDPGRSREHLEHIDLPMATLGSYSRRVAHGTPAAYLGPIAGHQGSLAEYYDRPLARLMVLHEVGHILGLAHEHQNPKFRARRRVRYRSLKSILEILNARLGMTLMLDEQVERNLRSQIVADWPGGTAFSDWRDYGDDAELDSVMSFPYHDCLLEDNGHVGCTPRYCPSADQQLHALTMPTASDRLQLIAMYGARA